MAEWPVCWKSGTGFHPRELTGRENVYLNGAILRHESRRSRSKFDEIVAFLRSGDKFLDTLRKLVFVGNVYAARVRGSRPP